MTINRRALLAGLTFVAAAGTSRLTSAQSWRGQYPELVYAVVPAENATGVTDRYTPFVDYLGRELGTKVTLRVANDYAAVIEGQRAGNIHIGYYGPASFSRARLTGVPTDAFVIDVNSDGSKGYYSVFYVLAKSPYQKIEDLKGKNLGLVDPNSTSGYNMPLYTLDKHGISPRHILCQDTGHRQPRKRGFGTGAGYRRCCRQLVERRRRLEPDTHAQ
jgi:phosphonate transport system substrate-binding protein